METKEIILPDGWEVKEVKGNRVILGETENKDFPTTWEGCLVKLNLTENIDSRFTYVPVGMRNPILALCQLLVCRNAWWKQLRWKPDWNSENEKYCIECQCGKIACNEYATTNKILTFPTPKNRNQFLETFRDLIEEAKELL